MNSQHNLPPSIDPGDLPIDRQDLGVLSETLAEAVALYGKISIDPAKSEDIQLTPDGYVISDDRDVDYELHIPVASIRKILPQDALKLGITDDEMDTVVSISYSPGYFRTIPEEETTVFEYPSASITLPKDTEIGTQLESINIQLGAKGFSIDRRFDPLPAEGMMYSDINSPFERLAGAILGMMSADQLGFNEISQNEREGVLALLANIPRILEP